MNPIDLILHLDRVLQAAVQQYGGWIYGILFLIIFCETGLVVTPVLPGDTLLFVGGALAAGGGLDMPLMLGVLVVAAVLGDTVNYAIGRWAGPRIFRGDPKLSRWLNPAHLARAHAFYERHGGQTIVLARFVPIVRTYAPFVAGMGAMHYGRFLAWNVGGAVLWVVSLGYAGWFFGNVTWVRENLTLVVLAIVGLSILPAVIAVWRGRA